ncbi:arginase family protein [Ectobacillus polymachus]|uniref:arginase family protein n=1 Tax=Ectobacillus polymachus TaxID=1508806 RepID=UPI003A8A1F59
MGLLQNGVTILQYDDTYQAQQTLLSCPHEEIDLRNLPRVNLYCEQNSLKKIKRSLSKRRKKGITFIGNGNYHYTTFLLLQEIQKPFTLILFDHHTDMGSTDTIMSCGSWVSFALQNIPMLKHVVIIGPTVTLAMHSSKVTLLPFQKNQPYSPKKIVSVIPTDTVYISIDKDILDPAVAVINWDQGDMNVRTLIQYLQSIFTYENVYGVDICGELPPSPVLSFQPSYQRSVQKNEMVNLKLLQAVARPPLNAASKKNLS